MAKILFFTGVPVNDGATLYRSGFLAQKLKSLNHKVVFTSVSTNFKKKEEKEINGLLITFIGQAHYFASKPFSVRKRLGYLKTAIENVKTCLRLLNILRQEKPDRVLLVASTPISLVIGLFSKVLGFKSFIDIEDLTIGQMEAAYYPKFLIRLYGATEKICLRILDKTIVCSHYLAECYPGAVILPNMIEPKRWVNTNSGFTLNKQETNIVFVGQIGFYHGQEEVLKSFAPVLRNNPEFKLIFIGGGEKMDQLKSESKKLRVEKQVVFTGQIPQKKVSEILLSAQVGLLPLWNTPVHQARHPLKLLEYLAASLVVATNDVSEARNLIKDGENGILCPPGDMKCLADKVETILKKPDLIKNIRKKAPIAVEEFDSNKIVSLWIKHLEI